MFADSTPIYDELLALLVMDFLELMKDLDLVCLSSLTPFIHLMF